jgi:glycopeptide antibiotics resistance protein
LKAIIKVVLGIFYFATLFYIFFLARRRRGPTLPWHKRHLNLIPLKDKIEYFTAYPHLTGPQGGQFYIDLFGNIILFVPFAFFLVFIFHIKSLRRIMLIAFLTSISIELIQLIFSIGVADIDDIILNIAGAALGALILKLLLKLKVKGLK